MSNADLDRRLSYLESRLARAEREIAARPFKPPKGGSSSIYTLQIGGGNTLSDGSTAGVKWAASAVTTVPSLYDPNTSPACVDGIGWGTLFKDNVSQGKVLIAHFNGNGSPLTNALVVNQLPLTNATKISIPLAGDPTQSISCYVPYSP